MHKIAAKEFTIDDFSHEHLFGPDDMTPYEERDDISKDRALTAVDVDGATCYYTPKGLLQMTCNALNHEREKYLTALKTEEETGLPAKDIWRQMIQLLPSSYNQKRTDCLTIRCLPICTNSARTTSRMSGVLRSAIGLRHFHIPSLLPVNLRRNQNED